MDFKKAFLEKGREKGEYLEQESTRQGALERFVADIADVVEVFNATLSGDEGFSLEVLPVMDGKSGLLAYMPDGHDGFVKSVYVDLSFSPETMEYGVVERDAGTLVLCDEDTMKIKVAEIVLGHLPNAQFLKLYRALRDDGDTEVQKPAVFSAPPPLPSFAVQASPAPVQNQPHDSIPAQGENIRQFPVQPAIAEQGEEDSSAERGDVPPVAPVDDAAALLDDDGDPLWEDEDGEGEEGASRDDGGVNMHLGTDVNMR